MSKEYIFRPIARCTSVERINTPWRITTLSKSRWMVFELYSCFSSTLDSCSSPELCLVVPFCSAISSVSLILWWTLSTDGTRWRSKSSSTSLDWTLRASSTTSELAGTFAFTKSLSLGSNFCKGPLMSIFLVSGFQTPVR